MYQSWWRGLAKVMIMRRTVLALICPFIDDPFNSSFADPCSHTNIRDQSFLCITCIYYSPYITCTCSGTDFRTSRVSTVVSPHFDSVLTTNDIHNKSLTSSNILRYRGFSVCVLPTTFAFCSVVLTLTWCEMLLTSCEGLEDAGGLEQSARQSLCRSCGRVHI